MSNTVNTTTSYSALFVKDRYVHHSVWYPLDILVPGSFTSIKDLHSFARGPTLSDTKLLVKGLKGPVLIHRTIEFFGLCNNDPHGLLICIPNNLIEILGVPIDSIVSHHATLLHAVSAEAFKACTPSIPSEEQNPIDDEPFVIVPALSAKHKVTLPTNFMAAAIIQEKFPSPEHLAFHLIEHLKMFDAAVTDGKSQGTLPEGHQIPSKLATTILCHL
jgi:hypothetical protein